MRIAPFCINFMISCTALCALLCSFLVGAFIFITHNKTVDFTSLAHYNPGHPTILLDDQGNEWARFQLDKRDPITLQEMPEHLIQAFLAAEDWRFFSHGGISYKGIVRSAYKNLYHGRIVQGASTITQQLVKLLFFDQKKTFSRKIKEQLYALLVEQQFSKEQILQTYLNHVCFGCGIYGVQAASQRFWGKHASQLTIDESALLAGIVRSPSNYCPIMYPLSAQRRRNIVLDSMHKLGYITDEQHEEHTHIAVTVKEKDPHSFAAHAKEYIRIFLEDQFGKQAVWAGGLTVQTTLSKELQEKAEQSFTTEMKTIKEHVSNDIDGALITIEKQTGQIKAVVGGYDFSASKFNRAFQARRQIGSVIKPLIYAAALGKGYAFYDVHVDEPLEIPDGNKIWRPQNHNKKFDGPMTLARALSRSNNIITVKTFMDVGPASVNAIATACGLPPSLPYPSAALGTVEATPKEVVGMFNIFANNGEYCEPHCIKWVKDQWGGKIWRADVKKMKVLSGRIADQVAKVMELSINRWRKVLKKELVDSDVISKTGTTNDCRSCWYAGSTPELTTVVYVGCDDNRSMGVNVYPIRTAFPLWTTFHGNIATKQKHFTYDSSLKLVYVDEITGKIPWRIIDDRVIPLLV